MIGEAPPKNEPRLYFLIRIPKSGSTTLGAMMRGALPEAAHFQLPPRRHPPPGESIIQRLRRFRKTTKRLLFNFGAPTYAGAIRKIARTARPGDVVSGHIAYGAVEIPGWRLAPITVIRDPVTRLISSYNYARSGHERRGALRRLWNDEGRRDAARLEFSDYVDLMWERRRTPGGSAWDYVFGSTAPNSDPITHLEENFFHFGALEELETFAATLSQKLGQPVALRRERVTGRRYDTSAPARTMARLEQLLERDIALHQAVLRHARAPAPRVIDLSR